MDGTGSKGRRRRLVDAALLALSLGALVAYAWNRRELLTSLDGVPITEVALVGALTVAGHLLNAHEFGVLYRLLGVPIGHFENWMLFSAGQAGNYLPGQVGTLYRFRYLKVVHGVSYGHATSAYSLNLAVTIFATGLSGLSGCLLLLWSEGRWSWPLATALVGLLVVALVPAVVPLPTTRIGGRVGRALDQIAEGWSRARAVPRATGVVLIAELTRYVLFALRLQIAFGWLDVEAPLAFFLVIGPVGALATFVSVTPAGLGVREAAIGAAGAAIGRPFAVGLLGSTADRAVSLLAVLVVGLPALVFTGRRLRTGATADSEI